MMGRCGFATYLYDSPDGGMSAVQKVDSVSQVISPWQVALTEWQTYLLEEGANHSCHLLTRQWVPAAAYNDTLSHHFSKNNTTESQPVTGGLYLSK